MATQTKKPPLTVSNPWWGHDPSDKQLKALWVYEECPDLFYGGAAGPGKTSYLLMAAVQYVHHPHYRALLLRKTYADLSLPDAIMDRAISWWDGVEGAKFNHADKTCYFPSGARVSFGYLASTRDHLRYQGAAVHFVGIDEASQIPSRQLEYLHSRIRRAIDDPIPLRYRLASNPGDLSHDWLKDTYVNGSDGHNVVYLPGLMTDNPGLDVEEYRKQLAHLDPVTRKQLEEGDWDVQLSGGVLDVAKLKYFTAGEFNQRVRYWDFAATKQKEGVDPDWTAGVLMGVEDGEYQVQDVQRFREGPAEVEARVGSQAAIDGPTVPVRIEQEPGSAGVIAMDHYARHVLQGRDFQGVRSTGSKAELGPMPPESMAMIRKDSFGAVLAACGASPALFDDSDGTSKRESLRQWHMGTVRPLARLLETELTVKLETDVGLRFDNYPLDLAGRAQSFQKLVAGGVAVNEALAVSGLLAED